MDDQPLYDMTPEQKSWVGRILGFCIYNKLVVGLITLFIVGCGIFVAPFDWDFGDWQRNPVAVDAIPDIGENQQIVFTDWPGRSPQDIENQITYPLTTALLGIPDIKVIRSSSMFGFSSIYVIFKDFSAYEKLVNGKDFYWTRSRVLEKLNSLPPGTLPQGVVPTLGPDATALGQIFWYTLEGRDPNGKPTGGWDLEELRTIEDWQVRLKLRSASGVSEVASIGGFVREYQIDVDPDAMRAFDVTIEDVFEAVRQSNIDVGAQTIELNRVEYLIRGIGFIKTVKDIEDAVIKVNDNVPVQIKHVAKVAWGPQVRLGALDKGGGQAVGGVVVARYGSNPLEVIRNVKDKIDEISPGLPSKTLADGTVSKVTIIPFYDRTQLINETLGTLNEAIRLQIMITIIVIIIMVFHLRASFMISALLPMAVLMCFIMMRYLKVDANIVALSGIAIAIGTMVDLGIILSENILRHTEESPPAQPMITTVYNATIEVSSAILTAVSTTIVSFLPVFTLQAAEGKLFGPLAYTKTFALLAALVITLFIMPALAHWLFSIKPVRKSYKLALNILLFLSGIILLWWSSWAGIAIILLGINNIASIFALKQKLPTPLLNRWFSNHSAHHTIAIVVVSISWLLAREWMPLGVANSLLVNFFFIALIIGIVLGGFKIFIELYPKILNWCLEHKGVFLLIPVLIIILGLNIWLGFGKVFGFIAKLTDKTGLNIRTTSAWSTMSHAFPGLEKEFMPALDEGSFLLMPTSMPHSGVEANIKYLQQLDMRVQAIPEVDMVVGKAGRVESALDPAPVSMFENIIQY